MWLVDHVTLDGFDRTQTLVCFPEQTFTVKQLVQYSPIQVHTQQLQRTVPTEYAPINSEGFICFPSEASNT